MKQLFVLIFILSFSALTLAKTEVTERYVYKIQVNGEFQKTQKTTGFFANVYGVIVPSDEYTKAKLVDVALKRYADAKVGTVLLGDYQSQNNILNTYSDTKTTMFGRQITDKYADIKVKSDLSFLFISEERISGLDSSLISIESSKIKINIRDGLKIPLTELPLSFENIMPNSGAPAISKNDPDLGLFDPTMSTKYSPDLSLLDSTARKQIRQKIIEFMNANKKSKHITYEIILEIKSNLGTEEIILVDSLDPISQAKLLKNFDVSRLRYAATQLCSYILK